jgi:hypothetical protein
LRISLIAAAFVALPLLAACGSGHKAAAEPRMSQADLSKALMQGGMKDQAFADCAAKLFIDSGMSRDALKVMAKPGTFTAADPPSGLNKDDLDKARAAMQKAMNTCLE